MEILFQQMPFIVAGTCLILGALLSRILVKPGFKKLWPVVLGLLVLSNIFTGDITLWISTQLTSTGIVSLAVSKYVSMGLLCFLSGLTFCVFTTDQKSD